ncbi:MAG TPA: ATP-binding protein [Clostridiaceae bacterium]
MKNKLIVDTHTNKLIVYKNLNKDYVLSLFNKLTHGKYSEEKMNIKLHEIIFILIEKGERNEYSGNLWNNFLADKIILAENSFSLHCEIKSFPPVDSLLAAATLDIQILKTLFNIDFNVFSDYISQEYIDLITNYNSSRERSYNGFQRERDNVIKYFSAESTPSYVVTQLVEYYTKRGSGELSRYNAFNWDNQQGFIPIAKLDKVKMEDLIGYKYQKDIIMENTDAFLKGKRGNNVLLYGDKGTGKSSTIKALINNYRESRLKFIEISKYDLRYFSKLIKQLSERNFRFIIFIDDLSFEEFETDYKYLKSSMEGSLEAKSENVLIYATSNRRHLVKESAHFSDNTETNPRESVQEKLSLSDRFGITLTFTSPNKEEYINIVKGIAKNIELPMEESTLVEDALKWELWHNGRSGRTAQQFINSLIK